MEILFENFIETFEPFFDFCEIGFRNDLIVNLLCRMPQIGTELVGPGDKVPYIFFIESGFVSIGINQSSIPFCQFKKSSWFGDF